MSEAPVPKTAEAAADPAQTPVTPGADLSLDRLNHRRRNCALLLLATLTIGNVLGTVSGAFTERSNGPIQKLFVAFVIAQVELAALWAAFGPARWSLRISGIGLYALLMGGMMLAWGKDDARGGAGFLLIYGAGVFIAAVLMRGVGWRVIDSASSRLSEKAIEQAARQFSLRDLLIWTGLSGGLLFVLKRLALDFTLRSEAVQLMLPLALLAVINLAAMWGALGIWHSLARGLLSFLVILLAGLAIAQVIPGPKVGPLVILLVIIPCYLFIVLLPCRFLGYRLVWRRPWEMAK